MEIFESPSSDKVMIGSLVLYGFVSDKLCNECNHQQIYYEKYDAFFCASCNQWKEERCSDPQCSFCRNRPEFPMNDNN